MKLNFSAGRPTEASDLEAALSAVGELLGAEDEQIAIVVVGGATLNLLGVVQRATSDFGLPEDRMNAVVEAQWTQGLPPGLPEDITWRQYGPGLDVGLVGRRTLIDLKLFAAVDRGPSSVHLQDLIALDPSEEELCRAADWIVTQDAAAEWASLVHEVIEHVERSRS